MADRDKSNEVTTPESTNIQPNDSSEYTNFSVDKKKEADNAKEQAQEWQNIIKQAVVSNALAWAEWKSDRAVLQAETQATIDLETYEWYIKVLDQLLKDMDAQRKTIAKNKKRKINESWKETLEIAEKKLKQYTDIIKGKQTAIEDEFKIKSKLNSHNPSGIPLEVNISKAEIDELKKRRGDRKKPIEYDIRQWQMWKSSNTAPWPNQSLEQVQKWNRVDKKHNNYDAKLNEALKDTALLSIIDNNQDRAREFLQAIANNSLSDQQITFCQTNMAQLFPFFEQYNLTNQVHTCIQTRGWRYNQSYNIYWNIDNTTAYKMGGVVGLTNNLLIKAFPNAKPEQVSNFTNIALAAGWIYAIYRVWKRFFSKNKDNKRNLLGKGAILASAYFVPQLLLWQDGFSLLWDILSWKADFSELRYRTSNCLWFMNNNSPEMYAQMAPWLLWMSIFPQTYTVAQVRSLQQTFSDQNARTQRYSTTYNRLNKDNSALANEFKNTFNQNQYNENEWKVFLAKLGITDKTSEDTLIFNEAMKITDKKTSFELWMKSQWKTRNPAFKKEIDEYLKDKWEFDPTKLNKDWFLENKNAKYTMREEDFQNKETLNNKVDDLPLNAQKKSELKTALEEFYDERTIESKPNINDFYLAIEENNILILKTHGWHETKIDLNSNTLKWFWSTNWNSYEIRFSNLSEALDVADLTNDILHRTYKQVPVANPPFEYKQKAICFNDAKLLSLDLDTRILNINRFTNRWTVDKHAKEYADYLSNCRLKANQVEINPAQYPLVDKLYKKTDIIFTNANEVENLETWLKKIKDELSDYFATPTWSPFKISWRLKSIDKKLVFTAVDWEKIVFNENISDNFPTILANQEKFLNFLNDRDNWMYNP